MGQGEGRYREEMKCERYLSWSFRLSGVFCSKRGEKNRSCASHSTQMDFTSEFAL